MCVLCKDGLYQIYGGLWESDGQGLCYFGFIFIKYSIISLIFCFLIFFFFFITTKSSKAQHWTCAFRFSLITRLEKIPKRAWKKLYIIIWNKVNPFHPFYSMSCKNTSIFSCIFTHTHSVFSVYSCRKYFAWLEWNGHQEIKRRVEDEQEKSMEWDE